MYSFPCMQNMGIVSGNIGLLLCLHCLSKHDAYAETVDRLIEYNWNNVDCCFNLGYGLAGVCLALQWIGKDNTYPIKKPHVMSRHLAVLSKELQDMQKIVCLQVKDMYL